MNNEKDLVCMAQCKITMQQSNLLDEMARANNTTRSYELRMILELYGRERLHINDIDRKDMIDAEKAGMSYYELLKELYPVKSSIPTLHSIPWYTGIQFTLLSINGLLDLEMINRTTRDLLFRYTDQYLTPIENRYPEIALIMKRTIEKTQNEEHEALPLLPISRDELVNQSKYVSIRQEK
jgi:hypothetical protein